MARTNHHKIALDAIWKVLKADAGVIACVGSNLIETLLPDRNLEVERGPFLCGSLVSSDEKFSAMQATKDTLTIRFVGFVFSGDKEDYDTLSQLAIEARGALVEDMLSKTGSSVLQSEGRLCGFKPGTVDYSWGPINDRDEGVSIVTWRLEIDVRNPNL